MTLEKKVEKWFTDKDLQHAPIDGQLRKLDEEVKELHTAWLFRDFDEVIDAIGDIQVVLKGICVQVSEQYGIPITLESTLEVAYNEIKDRTGAYNPKTKMWEKD